MALGRREGSYGEMWIATNRLARSPGHPFYERLNRVLGEAGFDRFVEERCKPFYAAGHGRPSIPPGVYFRMLMVGYFEGIECRITPRSRLSASDWRWICTKKSSCSC